MTAGEARVLIEQGKENEKVRAIMGEIRELNAAAKKVAQRLKVRVDKLDGMCIERPADGSV